MAQHVLLIFEARIATMQLLERILDHLARTTPLRVSSRLFDEVEPGDFTPDTYPIIVRSCEGQAMRAVRAFQRAGVAYGYYIDDNFWLLDPSTTLGRHYAARPTRRRLDAIVAGARPVIASTPLLRDWLEPRAQQVIQLDSFFDFSLVPAELPARPEREGLRVGFAASAYRGADLEALETDLLTVLDEHPTLEVEVIGAKAGALADHPRVTEFPHLHSYGEYIAFQRERAWDVGLAPLSSAESNRFKTDNKYREYAALGIAGIYQDAEPYAAVRDGENGLRVGGSQTWADALRRYCLDPGLVDRVRTAARADAERRLSIEAVAPQWSEFLEGAPSIGERPDAVELIRRRLGPPRTALGRAARRLRLLVAYGVSEAAEQGTIPTAVRTARFVLRGGSRRKADDER